MTKCEITIKTANDSAKRIVYGLYESTMAATMSAYELAEGVCYVKVRAI